MGFDDMEMIYTQPTSYLPLRVERDISLWLKREYLIEEYDQENYELTVKKQQGKKLARKHFFKENGAIYNAILLPFYLRKIPELSVGCLLA